VKQLLTVREVSDYLRVHPQTLYRMIREGRLRVVQLGGSGCSIRIHEDDLAEFVRVMREQP
jgi:excisionase family DNA binding protein